MRKLYLFLLFALLLPYHLLSQITVTGSNSANGNYSSLTGITTGAFARINAANQSGRNIIITINDNSTTETGAVALGAGFWTTLTIYPTSSGLNISGNVNNPLINFTGSHNVTLDGRVNATGSVADLTVNNTNTGLLASTVYFISSAQNNTIRYCNIKGSGTGINRGILVFITSSSGTGNDGNLIEYNNISGNNADRPVNALYSLGAAGRENSSNSIMNNNFYDNLNYSLASQTINLSSNNYSWTINGNSFYETTSFSPMASVPYYFILINNTRGIDFTVSDNFFGGRTPSCGGSPWTKTNAFNNPLNCIYFNVGPSLRSNIQNNRISNFNWSNSLNADWSGIQIAGGDVNIGSISGNTIGAITGTSSITLTSNTTGSNFYGVNITGTGLVNCSNNQIGSITTSNASSNASNIYGINKYSTIGDALINNNVIGSLTTPNSIFASSSSTSSSQTVIGISCYAKGVLTLDNNTICNLTNGSSGSQGSIQGIYSSNGIITISNNLIHDLSINNSNNVSNQTASVVGISLFSINQKTITGNTIYNLSNTATTFNGSVMGIYFSGSISGNIVSNNFIYNLNAQPNSYAEIYGIKMGYGGSTYSNNIISLGSNSLVSIYGIYETGAAGNDNKIYFNTVHIWGNSSSPVNKSYALYSYRTSNNRDFRNNLFINSRTTSGGFGLHYAAWFNYAVNSNLILDYNDYIADGTGGMLGRFAYSNVLTLPLVPGNDVNSFNVNPLFINGASDLAPDYKIGVDLIGISGTGITVDYGLNQRYNPTVGAWERPVNKWKGSISNDFNTPGNWTGNAVPLGNKPNIVFDDSPVNHCFLDTDHGVNNITNGQSTYRLVTNGYKLTVKGDLIFTGGAQIDASSTSSAIEFAGLAAQSIPSGSFLNDQVFNLIINNTNNVSLNGTLSLLNTLSNTTGLLDAITNLPTLFYAGTAAQTISNTSFLNGRVSNLIIDNTTGVTPMTDFTVDNSMTINSGKLFTISPTRQLTVSGTLTNNAGNTGLVIMSDVTGDGKLINNTSSVPATVQLYLTGGLARPGVGIYHYIIPSVESMYIGTTIAEVQASLGLTVFGGSLVRYVEPKAITTNEAGWQYFDNYPGPPPGFTSMQSTEGYNLYFNRANDIVKFKGMMNSAEHTFNLSYTPGNKGAGWNLIGNPYPCNYDLNGVNGLGTVVDGISNTVYYNNNGGYQYYNVLTKAGSTAGYTDILPPMTGFFVYLTNSSFNQLILPVTSKTSVTGDLRTQHKKSISTEQDQKLSYPKVKLVLSMGDKTDETVVLLATDAAKSYSEHYDAFKLFNTTSTSPDIYSEMNGVDYFMKAISPPDSSPVIIPLKVTLKEAGNYSINVTEFENLDGVKVRLKHGNIETSLNKDVSYSFTSGTGTFTDFELIIGERNLTKSDELPVNMNFTTWYSHNYINIYTPNEVQSGEGNLIIYDFNGKLVFNDSHVVIVPKQTTRVPVNLDKGFYIVDIFINFKHYKSKIVLY